MSTYALEEVKQKLYVEYADELASLVERGLSSSPDGIASSDSVADTLLTPAEQRLPGVTTHYSYLRQRLLCLRAAGVIPITPEKVLPPSSTCDSSAAVGSSLSLLTRPAAQKKRAALDYEIFSKALEETPLLKKMHALQEESVQSLRKNALILNDLRTASTADSDDVSNKNTSASEATVHNISVLRDNAGRTGDAFVEQRLSVLRQLEEQLKRERVTRQARQLMQM